MYRIKLNEFEGPLDLLLFFIQRDELDIHNIPISKITAEFCEYVNYMQVLDLEIASEFILMAATLIQIKAKMMIMSDDEEIEEEEDPRYELVRRLLEYKRYKDASVEVANYEGEQRNIFYRHDYEGDEKEPYSVDNDPSLQNLTLYNLIKAFKYAMDHRPKEVIHNITRFNVSLDEQVDFLNKICNAQEFISFLEIIKTMNEKLRIVVTFIAVLEMVKNGLLGIRINNELSDFIIFRIAVPEPNIRYDE
ncbi:MAG: segregation/condensation protein A [Ignavibacteria bacterium]|jgi:segregation and condensation protein A